MWVPTTSDLAAMFSVLTFVGALLWVYFDRRTLLQRANNAEGAAAELRIRLDDIRLELARLEAMVAASLSGGAVSTQPPPHSAEIPAAQSRLVAEL